MRGIGQKIFDQLRADARVAKCADIGVYGFGDAGGAVFHRNRHLASYVRRVVVHLHLNEFAELAARSYAPRILAVWRGSIESAKRQRPAGAQPTRSDVVSVGVEFDFQRIEIFPALELRKVDVLSHLASPLHAGAKKAPSCLGLGATTLGLVFDLATRLGSQTNQARG